MQELHFEGIDEPYEVESFVDKNSFTTEHIYYDCSIDCIYDRSLFQESPKEEKWLINVPATGALTTDKAQAWAETITQAVKICENLNNGKTWKIKELTN